MQKIESIDLKAATARLSLMKFFPTDPASVTALGLELERICGTKERLRWLVDQLTAHVPEWPGLAEIRGLFCSRFRPADGIEADCSLPGYAATDGERRTEAGQVLLPVDANRGTRALPQAEARLMLAGLQDAAFERQQLENRIEWYRKRIRENVRNPEIVRSSLASIAECEESLGKLAVTA